MSHEVMDGASGFGFLEAFVQGATERIHHFDLPGGKERGGINKRGVSGGYERPELPGESKNK